MCPLLQFVQAPLDGIPFLCCANCSAQLYAICKLAEDALGPIVNNKDSKETESQGTPLGSSLYLGTESLATTLWLHPSSQCLIHQTVHLSNPRLSNLKIRMLCGNHLPCFSSDFVHNCPLEQGKVSKLDLGLERIKYLHHPWQMGNKQESTGTPEKTTGDKKFLISTTNRFSGKGALFLKLD